jgi:DeoR/GlpR family transcriptional regulator of sugar metabolism
VAKICDLEEVSLVITDASADPSIVAGLAAVECDVQLAEAGRG